MSTSKTIYFKGDLSNPVRLVESDNLFVIRTKAGRDIEQLLDDCEGLGAYRNKIHRQSSFFDSNVTVHRFDGEREDRKKNQVHHPKGDGPRDRFRGDDPTVRPIWCFSNLHREYLS